MGDCTSYCVRKEDELEVAADKPKENMKIEMTINDKAELPIKRNAGEMLRSMADENTFQINAEKIIMDQEIVRELYTTRGPYPYKPNPKDETERVLRDIVELENGAIYYGFWSAATELQDGNGVMIWPDGSRYDGSWKQGQTNGHGRLIHADGDLYEGGWVGDKANGYGTYIHEDGAVYEGNWVADKQNGKGVETWPDGSRYEGTYKDGMKHGVGTFVWSDGSEYKGEFAENNLEGKGEYKWTDGRIYTGFWKDNKMHGRGTFTWANGKKYVGEYVDCLLYTSDAADE
eukprot:TRINITY_DN12737_c0_g1_i3.p1 TRINITY_DN12737_c0_g1~~TRINITY_DN12737_c0_g1_i3.p1  ORF type:complete len:288 (+),score=91.61 TRINITY_DN12737_c0_g1_i3:219-1082(+)